MIARNRTLNLVLSVVVILSMILATSGTAAANGNDEPEAPPPPVFSSPPGRNGLGPGASENGNPADTPVQMVDGVNVTNGNLFLGDLHYQFQGVGPAFGLQIAYNSQADSTNPSPMGRKWTHSLNWFVALDDSGNLELHKGDGEVITYPLACRQDVNRSGGQIDVIDIQLDANHWNTMLGDPGYDPVFDVALPANDKVDIRDVEVVAAAFAAELLAGRSRLLAMGCNAAGCGLQ